MVAVVQVVHRLHRYHDDGVELGALGGVDQAQLQLAASADDIVKNLLDGVSTLAGPARHHGPQIGFDGPEKTRGGGTVFEFSVIGKEFPQIVVVEIGPAARVVGALFL